MDDGAQKVTISPSSRSMLAALARKLDQSDAYEILRHIVGGDGLSRDDVVSRVIGLACLRDTVLQDADAPADLRELAERCGELSAEVDDDSPMDESGEALIYQEHSAALRTVYDLARGTKSCAPPLARLYPLDAPVITVIEAVQEVIDRANALADLMSIADGWARSELTEDGVKLIRWQRDSATVDFCLGADGKPVGDTLDANGQPSLAELGAVMLIEARREVVS